MASTEQWKDLKTRMASARTMIAIGLVGILLGGHIFHLLVVVVCGLMVWELVGMLRPGALHMQLQLGGLSALALLFAAHFPTPIGVVLLLATAVGGGMRLEENRTLYMAYAAGILLGGLGATLLRDEMGLIWMLWFVLVVVGTDVAGYFAGRHFGGPKFWPAISPNKTWVGTGAGWACSAVVGLIFGILKGAWFKTMVFSVLVSFASQMGDIAVSALKRKMGVKDSSNLIPGHGGLMDRFDGMMGASLFFLFFGHLLGFMPGLG